MLVVKKLVAFLFVFPVIFILGILTVIGLYELEQYLFLHAPTIFR
jgi:hypothetical protein